MRPVESRAMNRLLTALVLVPVVALPSAAREESYRLPPDEIVALVDAPPPPVLTVDPDGSYALVTESAPMPPKTLSDRSAGKVR